MTTTPPNIPALDASRESAMTEYRSGGWLPLIAAVLVAVIAAFVLFRATTQPVRAICARKVMRPGDLCIGKKTFNYETGMARSQWNHDHATASLPWVLGLIGLYIVFLLVRAVLRKSDVPDSPGATWHGVGAKGLVVGVAFGLVLPAVGMFMLIGPKNEHSANMWIAIGLLVFGLFMLWTSTPQPPQLIRADDDGLLVTKGARQHWIEWADVTSIQRKTVQQKNVYWLVNSGKRTTQLGPALSATGVLGQRLNEHGATSA